MSQPTKRQLFDADSSMTQMDYSNVCADLSMDSMAANYFKEKGYKTEHEGATFCLQAVSLGDIQGVTELLGFGWAFPDRDHVLEAVKKIRNGTLKVPDAATILTNIKLKKYDDIRLESGLKEELCIVVKPGRAIELVSKMLDYETDSVLLVRC